MPKSPSSPADGHPSRPSGPAIFISAAEPSADLHGADLIRKIRERLPHARFFGVAGPLMQQAGCEAMEDWTQQATMLTGAVRLARKALALLGNVSRRLREQPVNLAILIDSPALHLPMAKRIRRLGVPVLYYIAPQLWAWAPWRIRRVRRQVNRMAVILPFEEAYFASRGVNARFVGHPLTEQVAARRSSVATMEAHIGAGQPIVACLPGSRRHVIREVLPGQIEVAQAIAGRHPTALFLFAAANEPAAALIRMALKDSPLRHQVDIGCNGDILCAADLALVASGTVTLEVAHHRVPMVVMYNGSKWGYRLVGRWLIRTPHLSLVNILAGKRLVPEFMPYYTSTEPIAAEALDLLSNEARRQEIKAGLDAVVRSLGAASASEQTALMAVEMITEPQPAGIPGHAASNSAGLRP